MIHWESFEMIFFHLSVSYCKRYCALSARCFLNATPFPNFLMAWRWDLKVKLSASSSSFLEKVEDLSSALRSIDHSNLLKREVLVR